jgi:hydroxymethylbilane synthase
MATQSDIILDVALTKIGDKALFTKELELGMINQEIDFAVHSLKDLPTNLPERLVLAAITERENPADAVVVNEKFKHLQIDTLPEGSVLGTSSFVFRI